MKKSLIDLKVQLQRQMLLVVALLFIVSVVFDFTVTYTVAVYRPDTFVFERNEEFKAFISTGMFPVWIVLFHAVLFMLPFIGLWRKNDYLYVSGIVLMSVVAGQHIAGGMSWL